MSSSSEEGELPAVQNVLQKNFFFVKSSHQKNILSADGYEYHYEADSRTEPGYPYMVLHLFLRC